MRDRQLGEAKFRRQHPVGRYFADFACPAQRLIVEADGGQHADDPGDATRTAWLEARGWRVLRFWNNEILQNPEGVLTVIVQALAEPRPPLPPPFPRQWR